MSPYQNNEVCQVAPVAELDQVLKGELPKPVAFEYLRLYVAEVDWEIPVARLYQRLQSKIRDTNQLSETMRKTLCCAILLRAVDRSVPEDINDPDSLLFRVGSFHQFNEQDWFKILQNVVRRDIEIQNWRRQALELGVVESIQYQPYYRQAYNWMYGKAEEGGYVTEQNSEVVQGRLRRLTQAYGGSVICNIFTRHGDALKQVVNWRSGYFIERQIFKVYTIEQVLKIKKLELDQTNQRLIKQVSL